MEEKYINNLPKEASFIQNGLIGKNYDINFENIGFTYEDVTKGHDKYGSNNVSTYFYVVLDGTGIFKINNKKYSVIKNDIIKIPPKTKFVFAGNMKLLMISTPKYNIDNDNVYEDNDLC